ncbi:MAG: InlB B-repeat-containing protein [Candidatus Methanoplasma sp.]|jgi:hypothetical protein|nr:InlB B-repeat-containing protein [Candidatus Methanoplasma sp.]
MTGGSTIALVIGVVVIAAAGVSGAFFIFSDDGEDSFTFTYYADGNILQEISVAAGTSVTITDSAAGAEKNGRFIGWNTKPDMSGMLVIPGSQLVVDRNISLHAMIIIGGMYAVILPSEQNGFSVTADPQLVMEGGSSVIEYSLLPSHTDEDLVISVNGNPMKLDAMKRIHLKDIAEDQTVTVSGVYDKREHSISLPEDQRGYELVSSAEKVHHGESYTLKYRLLPGYRESADFGIHINGGDLKRPSGGELQVIDVMDNHEITLTGVEPIIFGVSSGKNISVLVNGAAASEATVEDMITILPAEGYLLPKTFNDQITGSFKAERDGYRITGDVSFPSVLKITEGENARIGNGDSKSIFVCPHDKIAVSAAPGYSLPGDYSDKLSAVAGVSRSADKFSFADDTVIPSVYKVVFNGHNKVHETVFVVGNTPLQTPHDNPTRIAYRFDGWDTSLSTYVRHDISIDPIWSPMTHSVFFGPNLIVEVGNRYYVFKEKDIDNPPRTISIKSDEKVAIYNTFDLDLPSGFGPQSGKANYINGHYEIIENCSFPGITYIMYCESDTGKGPAHSVVIGSGYTPPTEPTEYKEGFVFLGWTLDNTIVSGQITVENRIYALYPEWRSTSG